MADTGPGHHPMRRALVGEAIVAGLGGMREPTMSQADHMAWSAAVSLADVALAFGTRSPPVPPVRQSMFAC